ncbi:response regulator receiver protein [Candidatus Vecturithrix granuli]|uniref:histidine kinase n=1 Tax=Vecturithrix granuli TaxID=1499967 RepID=A0A081C6A7_VECG1|nr:response regulator receiver protein [Candidatus Vecturithrix granuli]
MKEPVILCVDDEEYVLRSLQRELKQTFGAKYLIETAERGEEALAVLQELLREGCDIPVILSDQIMPDMKGDELFRRVHEIAPKTLKIMLTGQADMQAVTNAVNQANLYRYIAKPWEPTDLALTIKEAIRRYFQDKALEKQISLLKNMNASLELKVKERTKELEAQRQELQALNASKDQLLSIIADNLRTPFTVLMGISNMIVKNITMVSREQMKESAASLRDAAESVYMLLENLLAWAQLQQSILEYQPQPCSLSEIVERNIYFFAARAEQKQIVFKNQIPKDINITGDRIMLNIIVRNLISNALKFSKPGGVIGISTYAGESYLDFIVSDTGVGIPRWELSKLFRIDSKYAQPGTDGEEGTGLGLLLCKALAEKNRAKIRVESEINQGTVVTVRFLGQNVNF